jgi:hypothetical protein
MLFYLLEFFRVRIFELCVNSYFLFIVIFVLNVIQILHSLVHKINIPVEEAICILSSTPAKIARLDHKVGDLSTGKRAGKFFFFFFFVK